LSEAPFTKWLFFVEKMEDESDGGYRRGSDEEAYHERALEEERHRHINDCFNRLEEAYRQPALEQERSSSSNEFLNSVFTAPLENTSDVCSGGEHVPEADEVDDQQWMENLGTAGSNLLSPKVSFVDKALQHENFGMFSGAMHFVTNMVSASVSEIGNMEMAISTCEDNEGVAAGSIDFFNPSFYGASRPDLSTAVTVGGTDSLNPVSFLDNIISTAVDEELLNNSYNFVKRFHESCNSVKDYFWEHSPQDVFQKSLLWFLLVPLSEFSESKAFDYQSKRSWQLLQLHLWLVLPLLIIMVSTIVVSTMLWTKLFFFLTPNVFVIQLMMYFLFFQIKILMMPLLFLLELLLLTF
jgi:hypothetical protein